MLRFEKRIWNWIEKNHLWIASAFAFILSLYLRFTLRDFVSGDMRSFLLPWYEDICSNGGLRGLGTLVGNYGMLYQTVIAFFTCLPIRAIYAYKLFSVIFDYLLAGAAGYMVYLLTQNKTKSVLAGILMIFLPCVFMNSAMWGQCDSIFTFFCLLALIFLMKEKYIGCFISYGVALTFKLQAIFLLPFLLFYYVYEKRFSFLHFFIIPPVMVILSLGGILQGRSVLDIARIYLYQANRYPEVTMSYPSFWNFLVENNHTQWYSYIAPFAIFVTVAALLFIMVWLFQNRPRLDRTDVLKLALLMSYTTVIFLPSMHDRYDFIYVAMAAILVILQPGTLPAFAGLTCIGVQIYGRYLLDTQIPWLPLVYINYACYLFYCVWILRGLYKKKNSPAESA